MKIFLLFFLSSIAQADPIYKVILNCHGEQGQFDFYKDSTTTCETVWDERVNGSLPSPLPCEIGACEAKGEGKKRVLKENERSKLTLEKKRSEDAVKETNELENRRFMETIELKLELGEKLSDGEKDSALLYALKKLKGK